MATPILVFDGDCGFCTSAKDWIARRVEVEAVPYQWADLDALGLSADEARARAWVVIEDARVGGADAIALLLRRARARRWRAVGAILGWPIARRIAEFVYRTVARHRHRLPGGTPACALPRAT